MGQASRDRRKQERKAKKSARQALYASYAKAGKLKNSKRSRKAVRTISSQRHPVTPCGNPACARCYPDKHGNNIVHDWKARHDAQ